jgi:hypothetical protein
MRVLRKIGLAALGVAVGGSLLYAAPPAPGTEPPLKSIEDIVRLTTDLRDWMEKAENHVIHLRTKAQKLQNPDALNCVNEALLTLKGERAAADKISVGQTDDVAAENQVFATLQTHGRKVETASDTAEACLKDETVGLDSKNVVDRPDHLDDPAEHEDDDIEDPGYRTPFD